MAAVLAHPALARPVVCFCMAGRGAGRRFAGARLARRLPVAAVRAIVILTGLVMAGLFFARAG